ncbi:T9SS type A sorting domain-containing protein [Polaribacter sp. MSW13]|uniref:T9SS type A sorting domain-containing protein n=1 Tax=Polaribacter marinus TaxID=2916838 RepID=A0A9X2ALK4_9FLAO|nr:T9SS type A sorting domain-containing protein [Polaribacter marinus]MCI2229365.1 T9SS type A sorting domain-containing protein [Polaribacter marinus]
MKLKLLLLLTLFYSFFLKAQIDDTQTWEVFYPGVKLTYHINACANNESEPNTEEYFWCDGPDRVTTESFGLTHGNVISSHEFTFNNDNYTVFTTEKGISIYNISQKKWRNIPFVAFNDDNVYATFYGAIDDGNGNIIFHGASKGTQKYSLTNNTITQISDQNRGFNQFKKNENEGAFKNSVWAISGSSLMKYHNGVYEEYDSQDLGIASNIFISGIDIGQDNKIYLAVDNEGILIFNPVNGNVSIITEADGLPSNFLQDLDFDNDGYLWIAYRTASKGGVSKWDITNNTFENFEHTIGNSTVRFNRIEVVGNKIWLTARQESNDLIGVYNLTFESNNTPVWQHYDQAFFQQKGFIDYFYIFGYQAGVYDLASYGDKLYMSVIGGGTVVYENGEWQHYSPLKNNIPTGNNRRIGFLKQDKTGGVVFSTFTSNSGKDILVASKLKNDIIENQPIGKGVTHIGGFEEKGQIDENGNVYGRYLINNNGSYEDRFSALNYPVFNNLLENYSLRSGDKFAVEGFNRWYFDENGGRLTNLDTNVSYTSNNSNFDFGSSSLVFLTEAPDERIWSISSASQSESIKWYDPVTDTNGVLALANLNYNSHSEIGNIEQLLFGTNTSELWLIGKNGVIFLKNEVETHKLLKADYPTLNTINDAKIDADNNLYVLSSNGLLKISDIQNATPTTKEFYYPTTTNGPNLANFSKLTIDNQGNKWLASTGTYLSKLLKFKEVNDTGGIVNAATTSSLRGKASGKIFVDINENGTYEEATDVIVPNQALNIKKGSSSFIVYSDNQGNFSFPIYIANQTYEIALTSTDGFSYTPKRVYKVDVTNLDADYSNNNIDLKNEDLKSLYVKGSTKEGAWGFVRDGFDNRFVTSVGNLSRSKIFNNVKLRYEFINTNENNANYNVNSIASITLHRLKNNQSNNHIINKINIDPGKSQFWKVNLESNNYTISTDINPVFTESNTERSKIIEIELGNIDPFEAIVLEVKTGVFDPTAIGDNIQFGPTAISSSSWENPSNGNNPNLSDWIDVTPESNDNRLGDDEDFSPYEEPEDIYLDEDDVYRDEKELFFDGPYFSPIFSSYDPNDKLVTPGVPGKLNEVDIDRKWLTYTIRFQNNGNFSAKDIYVLDTIDDNFDKNSFKFLESSHNVKISEVGDETKSIKKFLFQDIYLPDSLSSPIESQGYFKYKIKAKKTITENTIVENTAYIYFDQNPYIVTNTTQNKFKTPATASLNQITDKENLFLYPNPANSKIAVSLKETQQIQKVDLYNIMGQIVVEKSVDNLTFVEIDISKLSKGIYFVKVFSKGKTVSKKLIIK